MSYENEQEHHVTIKMTMTIIVNTGELTALPRPISWCLVGRGEPRSPRLSLSGLDPPSTNSNFEHRSTPM